MNMNTNCHDINIESISNMHIHMYLFYPQPLFPILSPPPHPPLPPKKKQIQFFICLIKVTQSMLTGCDFPMWMQWTSVFYGFSLVALFSNFYYQAYIKARQAKKVF